MKKIIISFLIILICGGCWNYKELNDYALATGMAIDYIDNKYIVSFLISNGKSGENSQYQAVLYSGEGMTIYEAIKDIGLVLPKQLYIGHLTSIVVSEDVAKLGLYDSLEFLLEDSGSKKNFYVVLAKDCKARDVLSIKTPMTDSYNKSIFDNVNSSYKLQGGVVAKTFNDVIYELINDGIDTSISSYVIVGDVEEGATFDNLDSTTLNTYIKLDDLGIFKGDKLVAWADKDISRGINIINNDLSELYVDIDCDGGHIVVNTTDLKTNSNVSKDYIDIRTKGRASISEVTCDFDLENEDNINQLKKDINDKIEDLIKKGYYFARNFGSDVFGFGLSLYRNNPIEYKNSNFNEIYLKLDPRISVDIDINNYGNIKQSIERIANNED